MPGEWEQKAWGRKRVLAEDATSIVEELLISAGGYCSRHFHERTDNLFLVLRGRLRIVASGVGGEIVKHLGPGDSFLVEDGVIHRFECDVAVRAIEVSTAVVGHAYDPTDIVRQDTGGIRRREQQS